MKKIGKLFVGISSLALFFSYPVFAEVLNDNDTPDDFIVYNEYRKNKAKYNGQYIYETNNSSLNNEHSGETLEKEFDFSDWDNIKENITTESNDKRWKLIEIERIDNKVYALYQLQK